MLSASAIVYVVMILSLEGLAIPAYDYVPSASCRDVQEALAAGKPLWIEIAKKDYPIRAVECRPLEQSTS